MKQIEHISESRICKLIDNETPFMVIDCPNGATVKLYWTKGGMYGAQVQTVIYTDTITGRPEVFGEKTNGCGYSKRGEALTNAFAFLGLKPERYTEHSDSLYDYHVGGNYYKITK